MPYLDWISYCFLNFLKRWQNHSECGASLPLPTRRRGTFLNGEGQALQGEHPSPASRSGGPTSALHRGFEPDISFT